jgi:transposase
MFWGCMGWQGTGYGSKLETSLTKEVYVQILEDEFLKSLEHLGMEPKELIYMHDNARPHKAKISLKWPEEHGIECLEWTANSPDLNPIENLWAELKRRLGEYQEPLNGMLELGDRVQTIWDGFTAD